MKKNRLGNTNLLVSNLCFGTLTLGSLQNNYDIDYGSSVISHAINSGINFFDTAQLYQTYDYIREGIKKSGNKDVIISSKTYAYTREMAVAAVEEARRSLDRDYIDIFMLHEQESIHTINGHRDALDYLLELKSIGVIKAVGLSTHHVSGVYAAIESTLDVVHPIYNANGLGIVDGNCADMSAAIYAAKKANIGVFTMKALGGGNLFSKAAECFDFVINNKNIDAVAVGLGSIEEVEANINYFTNRCFSKKEANLLAKKKRRLIIEDHCTSCGCCVAACSQSALSINNTAVCDSEKCVLCGYCSSYCKEFCIKII